MYISFSGGTSIYDNAATPSFQRYKTISEFDPVDETWKEVANLYVKRAYHSVSVVKTIDIINDISPEDCRLQLG